MMPPPPPPPGNQPPQPPRLNIPNWIIPLLMILFIGWFLLRLPAIMSGGATVPIDVPYSFFYNQVQTDNVESVKIQGTQAMGTFKKAVTWPTPGSPEAQQTPPGTSNQFTTTLPPFPDNDLLPLLRQHNVSTAALEDQPSPILVLLINWGPLILIGGLLFWSFSRTRQQQGTIFGFGQTKARRYSEERPKVTFADVAGEDAAKSELSEMVDFLKDPDKYLRLGARIPRGVLLIGPPGTGKTLLARAVAGEANVPFFSLSASEFIEAIVGVGASRVRDLFKKAKEAAPSIVFIDELDAIGRSRTSGIAGFSGGNDEREQTLNQILTEMDGFDSSTNVIVIGATNRPDVLDQALLRPGRFDRRVAVQPPDRAGREAILKVHTRGVPLASDVDLGRIAATTPGMVGADLANLVNEAALLAARRNHEVVDEADFTDAIEKIVLGAERKVMMSSEDRQRTAYHEGGHAIVGMLTEGADPVRKISIIPRGLALGVTFSAPDADRFNYTEQELRAKIKVALGGRAAEEAIFGDLTTGAESDIQQLTQIARQMVGRWGMSSAIGTVAVLPMDGQGPLLPGVAEVSQET